MSISIKDLEEFEAGGCFNVTRYRHVPDSSVWTALYYTMPNNQGMCSCFHVQWGEELGPKISYDTAYALAVQRLNADHSLRVFAALNPQSTKSLRY